MSERDPAREDWPDVVSPAAPETIAPLEAEATDSMRLASRRFLLLILVAVASLVVLHFTPLRGVVGNVQWLKAAVQKTGFWAPAVFVGISTALVAFGVPRLLFSMLGGMLFGFLNGLVFSHLSALAGSYFAFVFARWSGREWVLGKLGGNPRLNMIRKRPSVLAVFLLRQLPVAGVVLNLAFGMSAVSHRTFLAGSFIGLLPTALVAALIGSGLGKQSPLLSFVQIGLAAVCIAASLYSLWRLRRRLPARATPA